MREPPNNAGNLTSDASGGTAGNNSIKGKEVNVPKAQMDIDFSEDDLLGEENELSEAARDFVGVKRGHSVNVKSATSVAGHFAPGRLLQRPSQLVRPGGQQGMVDQPKVQEKGSASGSAMGQKQEPTEEFVAQNAGATVGAALDSQQSLKQSSFMIEEEQVQVSVG